ncbi:MAG: hypothetical protein DLM53_03185 [Candidatus Eremiobacter antarcticus]|nr:polysaccharide biosynthesis tyrosine autokinase [Candidatus Eremiobacteraeota bacterium]MBC5808418.1 polysaccharide biosynthesis tyrosine autokinase [Candidatus Eremiobacteraeota bacterium]PZR63777.1 MAG: hypothetical protein DLM53_03185 [Candidatus Eremiobacter sp. RRmetagenome_bin22]
MYYGPAMRGEQMRQLPSGLPGVAQEQPAGPDFASIIGPLIRRRRLLLSLFLTFFGLVILFTLLTPKTYTTSVKMIAGNSNPGLPTKTGGDTAYPLLNALLFSSGVQSAETYAELLQETPVVQQVIRNLHLNIDASTLLSRNITIKPVTNTSVLNLSATWSDPQTSAKIANEFASVFLNRERELIASQASSAIDYLSKQMPSAEKAMQKADNALARFQSTHTMAAINAQNQGAINQFTALDQKVAQTQVDQGQAQAQLASVLSQMGSVSPTINGTSNVNQNPVVSQLQTQLAQVNVQLESARKQFTDEHPSVVALKEQKAQIEKEIRSQPATVVAGNAFVPNPVYQQLSQQAATLRAQISGDAAQLGTLQGQLNPMSSDLRKLPAETVQLANLQRKAKLTEDVYTAMQQKLNEATVAKTTALSDVAITQAATPGDADVKPKLLLNLLLGFMLGLVIAVSGVFIMEFFDNTFKTEEDVQRALPFPVLSTIPALTTKSTRSLPWLRALTIESFLQLVTALRYSSDKPLRTLAITSPNQGDGKSTIALSTAIAMAEMEPTVVLIDADLRRPSLHERTGCTNERGLSDVLVGAAGLWDVLQQTKYEGLMLLSSGTRVPNPMKLLQSQRFDDMIAELLQRHRAIVFDTPALLAVHDAAVLSSKVDGAVLVVSAGMTDMPSTKRALQRLGAAPNINVLGVVLNRVAATNGYRAYYLNGDSLLPLPHETEPEKV